MPRASCAGTGVGSYRFHCRVLYEHDESRSACRESPFAGDRRSLDGFAYRLLRAVPSCPCVHHRAFSCEALPDIRRQTWSMVWVSSAGLHLAITAIFAVTEDMVLSRRVFKRVQKSLRWPWLAIFRPGGGRGAAWILTQMAVLLDHRIVSGGPGSASSSGCSRCAATSVSSAASPRSSHGMFQGTVSGLPTYARVSCCSSRSLQSPRIILQYFVAPSRVFDGTFSAYHILNPFRALCELDAG